MHALEVAALGVSGRSEAGRPVLHVVEASWRSGAAPENGLAGLPDVKFVELLKHAGDRQHDFVTQVHEASARLVTLLGTAGPGRFGSAAVRKMDWTGQTKRDLIERRSVVDGAVLVALRAVVPATSLLSGRDAAQVIGESKDVAQRALAGRVRAEYADAALVAWAALIS